MPDGLAGRAIIGGNSSTDQQKAREARIVALDYPRAWELARAAEPALHHPECSYVQTTGALLCDPVCPVIAGSAEFQCAAMRGHGGAVIKTAAPYGPCPGHGTS